MQVKHLAATQRLAQDGFFDERDAVLANERFDGKPLGWRRGNNRQVPQAAQCHVQRSRDRCRCHGQNIHLGSQRFDRLFLFDAKAMLLIDDQQSQVTELKVTLQKFVSTDQNIDLATSHPTDDVLEVFGRLEA